MSRLYVVMMSPVFFFFSFSPHLLRQTVQNLLQPGHVQLQRDRQQLLSQPEHQRLQLGHAGQQLPRSGALIPGVRDRSEGERGERERRGERGERGEREFNTIVFSFSPFQIFQLMFSNLLKCLNKKSRVF